LLTTVALLAVGGLFISSPIRAEDATTPPTEASEYAVKTAFIYRMAELVTWPEKVLGEKDAPVRIGIVGTEPDAKATQQALSSRTIHGHSIKVVPLGDTEQAQSCHIVFVSRSGSLKPEKILKATTGRPILVIGESKDFIEQGGHINFVTVDDKIRFEINNAQARQDGLVISSRLLGLATRVIPIK
jgi:hypothetical protein